jgi:hypothetical protein
MKKYKVEYGTGEDLNSITVICEDEMTALFRAGGLVAGVLRVEQWARTRVVSLTSADFDSTGNREEAGCPGQPS